MSNIIKHKRPEQGGSLLNPFANFHQEAFKAMIDFYDLFQPMELGLSGFEKMNLSPPMDIVEDEKKFKIEIEMPGLGEEDIEVSVKENTLFIEAEKSTSKKNDKKDYLSREISYGRYERSIALPQTADIDKASATFKKGMLWIEIPKKSSEETKERKLKIEKPRQEAKSSKKDESRKNESRKKESKKAESKKAESRKDESKTAESRKDESKKEESRKDESKKTAS